MVHDLLYFQDGCTFVADETTPAWVPLLLQQEIFLVVRRALIPNHLVPVGVRGKQRSERYAFTIGKDRVGRVIQPEDLAYTCRHVSSEQRERSRVFAVLDEVAHYFAEQRVVWGPVGSVGYELATKRPVVGLQSDLDLIVRAETPIDMATAKRWWGFMQEFPVRLDVLIETPNGGVSLREYASSSPTVLLRTVSGPVLHDRNLWAKKELS